MALMSLLGVLKLHTTLRRQTARHRRAPRTGRRAPGPHPRALKSVFPYGSAALKAERSQDFCWPDSCRAQAEGSMCVRVCPRWGTSRAETARGSVVSLYSCARARRVKSCRGSRAHTLRPWALSHTHTMRPRRLGLGLGPRALGSHTRSWYFMPRWDAFSVSPLELRVAGRSTESPNQRRPS